MKTLSFCLLALIASAADAQVRPQWDNASLRDRQTPQEQYAAIGKANLAQCQINANREVRTVIKDRLSACN